MDSSKKILLWLLIIAAVIYVFIKVDNKIVYWTLGIVAFCYSVLVIKNLIENSEIDWD